MFIEMFKVRVDKKSQFYNTGNDQLISGRESKHQVFFFFKGNVLLNSEEKNYLMIHQKKKKWFEKIFF